jgi:primosomal protein N'
MKLVEISPITHSVQKDSLTYFSSKNISIGDIVSVEVRSKKFDALVINVSEVKDGKGDIKTASFGLKKITEIKGKNILYEQFFKSCHNTKEYFIGNLGAIINYFLPKDFLENYENIVRPKEFQKTNPKPEIKVLQKPLAERLAFYKKYIDLSFENRQSIQIILPTIEEVRKISQYLAKDFSDIWIFHSKEKKTIEKYNSLLKNQEPVLIISTPSFLFIPRHDLGAIILEHESSGSYHSLKKPYFDIRNFAKFLAKNMSIDLIFADEFLSVETVSLVTDKKTLDFNLPNISPTIINMSDKLNKDGKNFVLSKQAIKMLEKSDQTFLFTLRKGLATQIICHDCKHILKDDGVLLTLFERDGKRILKNAHTNVPLEGLRCPNCGSWNFDQLVIGTDTVYTEIKKYFPNKKIFQIDKETTKTESSAKKIIAQFYQTKNSVLIGTEMAIQYLKSPIDNTVIVSMDTLCHIPSYKVQEKIFHLILGLETISKKDILVQTREINNPVLEAFMKNDLKSFYKSDLARRETFSYPPFGTIIKITHSSTKDEARKVNQFVEENLTIYKPSIRRLKKGKFFQTNIILKIPKDMWNTGDLTKDMKIDENLYKVLSSLGPDWQIRINPENLF